MKLRTIIPPALGLSLALSLPARAEDAQHAPHKPMPAAGAEVGVDLTATVEAINYDTREVTLKGQLGNEVTLTADPQIKRLNEIKVGDHVNVQYYASLAAELRTPTAEELKNPLQVVEDKAKADAGAAPAAGGYRVIKAVVTIEGLDRQASTANLKGPRGNFATVKVQDPAVFTNLHIGDAAIVVYTEAVAVKLVKAPAAPAAEKKPM
ncbi:MAG TPA: hypothetical protein VFJ90_13805 [Candidatus Didemnitutus sp.]|nr:hypothetical protein [Candidatus Didemnitutus sp.]